MRLIDADKIVYFCGTTKSKHDPVTRGKIEKMPTVKAIPIEFINEQIAKTTDINNRDEFDVLYAGNLGYLLKLWEEENEKDI